MLECATMLDGNRLARDCLELLWQTIEEAPLGQKLRREFGNIAYGLTPAALSLGQEELFTKVIAPGIRALAAMSLTTRPPTPWPDMEIPQGTHLLGRAEFRDSALRIITSRKLGAGKEFTMLRVDVKFRTLP